MARYEKYYIRRLKFNPLEEKMSRIEITRTINAPVDKVFKTVSDISEFSKAIPHIVNVDILSDIKSGIGTRFRETRLMRGKETTAELEVTEYTENEQIRIVSDTHGTVWDTVFTVKSIEDQTELAMTMDATAYKLIPKLMNPLIKSMLTKAIAQDMDAVKVYCEK
jgi:ribosome-associated toxin RatA of RatAB toxin-antitoxin module